MKYANNTCDQILFVIPVFNDWESLSVLLSDLDCALKQNQKVGQILAVDDSSNNEYGNLPLRSLSAIESVFVLHLKRNLGHQRAITIGLAYVQENFQTDIVVVMDGDGEDSPNEAMRLIDCCQTENLNSVIFARRSQRSEPWQFQLFYKTYRGIYWMLTGFNIQVGNFSVIPFRLLPRLTVVSEIWNHYAAGILKAKIPCKDIPTRRAKRYCGKSKMNFTSLVTHGLSAISVYGEKVGVRLLLASIALMLVAITLVLVVIAIRLMTNWAIPGWASFLLIVLFSVILQMFTISLAFIFLILNGRDNTNFLPIRDYHCFVLSTSSLYTKNE
ncbi:MAG: glycosyltransferase [Microcystis sp. M090S1]|uniref:glycosyltransferase n=1 Tax=Microcystis sp. M090S1 TaxID=2771135 RepID=UPI002589091B|nr:glycosyltransferase [Microcystis sp. M090S1]MCA2812328.1 glycosyltransferase [Microcystis sp. M090S1]